MKIVLVLFVILFPIVASAQVMAPPVIAPQVLPIYDSFDACMAARRALPTPYFEDASVCNMYRRQHQIYTPNFGIPVLGSTVFTPDIYGYGGGYYPGFFFDRCLAGFPEASRPVKCVRAEVKFDIGQQSRRQRRENGDLSRAEVFIDGISMGQINKYSHAATSGLSLVADKEYVMEVVWSSNQGIKTVVRRIKPSSMLMQDGSYWFPISENLFGTLPYGREGVPERDQVGGKELILGK